MSPLDADLGRAAGPPERDLDMAAVHARAAQLRRRRRLGATAGSVAFASIAVMVALTLSRLPSHDLASHRLPLPPPGEALGTFLDDVPVWVVQTIDGEVYVLRASSPDGESFHSSAAHWLRCSEPILESLWGTRFLPDGTAIAGPGGAGLHRYEVVDVHDGDVDVGTLRPDPEPRDHTIVDTNPVLRRCPRPPDIEPHPAWAEGFEAWYRDWYRLD